MLLKKLFKNGKSPEEIVDPDEEPARHAAPAPLNAEELKKRTAERLKAKGGGFDPYNSGTFKKENAWERVTRK